MADSFKPDSFTADDPSASAPAAPSAGDSFTPQAPVQDPSVLGRLKAALGTGIRTAGKVGNYIQGATVSPLVALGTEAATGKPVFNSDEYLHALDPRNTDSYPQPSELLARGGVQIPRGPRVSDVFPSAKDKWYDASAGGVADFALNTATDPSTYLSMGLSAAAKGGESASALAKLTGALGLANDSGLTKAGTAANAVLNPVEAYSRARAPGLYDKAFEDVNRVAAEQGKALKPSDLLRETGFQGGAADAEEAMKAINSQAGAAGGHALDTATQQGAKLNLMDTFQPAMDFAAELRKKPYPEAAQLAQQIDDRIQYALEKSGGSLGASEANELKSSLNGLIKDSGFAQGTEASLANRSRRALSTDLSSGVKQAVTDVNPTLGNTLNEQWQKYAASSPSIVDKLHSLAGQAAQKRGLLTPSAVDMMMLGGGVLGDNTGYNEGGNSLLAALLVKKLGTAAFSMQGRTLRGKIAQTLADQSGGLVDSALRQGAWDKLDK